MKVKHLKDDPGLPDGEYGCTKIEGIAVLVTKYESGDYDGGGTSLALMEDGTVLEFGHGHCSCFGPWEGGWSGEKNDPSNKWATLEEFSSDVRSNADSELSEEFLKLCAE